MTADGGEKIEGEMGKADMVEKGEQGRKEKPEVERIYRKDGGDVFGGTAVAGASLFYAIFGKGGGRKGLREEKGTFC